MHLSTINSKINQLDKDLLCEYLNTSVKGGIKKDTFTIEPINNGSFNAGYRYSKIKIKAETVKGIIPTFSISMSIQHALKHFK